MNQIDEINSLLSQNISLYDQWARAQGISYNMLAVLYGVSCYEGCTQKMIGERWGLPKQTVFSVCRQLKDKGWLDFEQADGDKREKLLHFTTQGRAAAEPIVDRLKAIETAVIGQVGAAEMENFINHLQRLNRITAQVIAQG
ncbi:MarR family transcriptional regulator [Eikenella sp. S3360]|uniref:MarR family transcriptional regulator n=1 Tax=Eikenella glucosivorans TaxID=2766967 RepID=A0ABS0N9F6_9NEIS|nr:MarR family transcriptional regulator [Eikenella glucosivorans]MBH5328938.1 MarR family transcriptional regulator [Eikenella glucosivorans]